MLVTKKIDALSLGEFIPTGYDIFSPGDAEAHLMDLDPGIWVDL
jgi:hypothetical protein